MKGEQTNGRLERLAVTDKPQLTYPCAYPIKVVGYASEEFDTWVVTTVRQHAPDLGEGAVQTRASRESRYMAVTITITAQGPAHIETIFHALRGDPRVIMVL